MFVKLSIRVRLVHLKERITWNHQKNCLHLYREWEKIWDRSKIALVEKYRKSGCKTHFSSLQNELKNTSENAAEDLATFVRGLEVISGLGM